MNAETVIREVKEHASEWLEMSDNPDRILSGILAHKIVELTSYIEYLEKRIQHVTSSSMADRR